jgi:predicted ester cyclase
MGGLLAGFAAFTDMTVTIDDLAVDGDRVGARYTSRARQQGEFLGIPNTGTSVEFGGAGIHRIQDGKIAEVWTVDDWAALTRQLRAAHSAAPARTPVHGVREASPGTVAANKRTAAQDVVGEGDIVFLRTSSHGTHTGELFGVPGTGRAVSYKGIATYYLADGKITHEWFNDDMFALRQAISRATDAPAAPHPSR